MKMRASIGMSLLTTLTLIATLASLAIHANGRVIAMPGASTTLKLPQSFQSAKERFSNLNAQQYEMIHFYEHEMVSGENQTVWPVASADITDAPTYFGLTQVVDNLLTLGRDNSSTPVGRVQGMRTFTGLDQAALSVNLNFVLTLREYSVISVQGRVPVNDEVRLLSIVGGTGFFPVRGFALAAPSRLPGNSVTEYVLVIRRDPL